MSFKIYEYCKIISKKLPLNKVNGFQPWHKISFAGELIILNS
jgi:hypothetical protein